MKSRGSARSWHCFRSWRRRSDRTSSSRSTGPISHAWDPLAHLNVTTTAMGNAARLVDELAHRPGARGRWLATGGGGYDAYRVVPRAWALVWLAGAHHDVPSETPAQWRERWAADAERYGQSPLPTSFDDPPLPAPPADGAIQVAAAVRRALVPRIVREGVDRGWFDPLGDRHPADSAGPGPVSGTPARALDGRRRRPGPG